MRTRSLKIILIVAALLRLALLAGAWNAPDRLLAPDSKDYAELAVSLAADGEFSRDGQPEVFRTPGYPLVVALAMAGGESWPLWVALLQIVAGVLAVYLTFLLGWLLWSQRVGLWAAGLQAVNPLSIAADVRVLSDSLYALLLLLALVLLAHHVKSSRGWPAVAAAAVLGVSCYIRPVGVVPVVIVLAVLAARALVRVARRRGEARQLGRVFLLAAVASLLVIAPWTLRNHRVGGYPSFSSAAQVNIFHYEAPAVLARTRGMSLAEAREYLGDDLRCMLQDVASPTPGQIAAAKGAVGGSVLRDHPGVWIGTHLKTSLATLLPGIPGVLEVLGATTGQRGTLEVLQTDGLQAAVRHYFGDATWAFWLCIPAIVLLAAKYVFALIGAVRALRGGAGAWVLLLVAGALLFVAGPAATPRFRVPVAALLSTLAAAGWVALLERLHHSSCSVAKRRFAEEQGTENTEPKKRRMP
jgi:4-amino-4-deoxy-L-arabinose transferase-like glycosyltransferase